VASLAFDRNSFSERILRRFFFLRREFGFRKRSIGEADEVVHEYAGNAIAVTITLSYPELPHLVLARRLPSPASFVYGAGGRSRADALKRRYYRSLGRSDTDDSSELLKIQHQFSEVAAEELQSAIECLTRDPGCRLSRSWSLSSRRFPR
jgi:hypothetical protein